MSEQLPRIGPKVKKPEGWHLHLDLIVPEAIKIMKRCGCPSSWTSEDVYTVVMFVDGANGPIDHGQDFRRLKEWGGPELVIDFHRKQLSQAMRIYELFHEAAEPLAETLLLLRRHTTRLRENLEFQVACCLCDALSITPETQHLWSDGAETVAAELRERLGLPGITGKIVEKARRRVRDAVS